MHSSIIGFIITIFDPGGCNINIDFLYHQQATSYAAPFTPRGHALLNDLV